MAKGDDIKKRLIKFATSIIKLSELLPDTRTGRHISSQILRSGTSPAANYAEARSSESRKDFVHKLKITLKELNETDVWLSIIEECELLNFNELLDSHKECRELCRITNSSIKTASDRLTEK